MDQLIIKGGLHAQNLISSTTTPQENGEKLDVLQTYQVRLSD